MAELRDDMATSVALAEQEAALFALASAATRLESISAPDWVHHQVLRVDLATMPAQLAHVPQESALGHWLTIASLAEQRGMPERARQIVDGVRQAIEKTDRAILAENQSLEWRAICWARRGRIARTAGRHDDAFECYSQARRLVHRLPWLDARPIAELGLAALAATRGNYPAVIRHATSVLRCKPALPVVHRFGAHHMMTLAQRKRHALVDALLHGWAAIDMVPRDDVRSLEVLLSLSEIAIELDDLRAAEAGFASVLKFNGPLRIQVSALVGAVASCIRPQSEDAAVAIEARLSQYQTKLVQLVGSELAPRDECRRLFALAELHRFRDEFAIAAEFSEQAAVVAREFGFFEQQFRLDEFVTHLSSARASAAAPRRYNKNFGASGQPYSAKRHPALSRLVELAKE